MLTKSRTAVLDRDAPRTDVTGLQVRDLTVGYPGRTVIEDLSLEVAAGDVTAIIGPNGCGKSTLLRAIARLHRPESGAVTAGGQDVWRMRPREAARVISLLPQAPSAPAGTTVADLVAFGRQPHHGLVAQWTDADETAVTDAMTATNTTTLATRELAQLSGGQQQRAWVAMTLAQQTPVMLLDEPTSALDLGHSVEVLDLMRTLARTGRVLLAVLHDMVAAARYADHLVAVRAGRIIAAGPPREIVTPELVRTLYGVDADVLTSPTDGAPVVVPRGGTLPGTDVIPEEVS